MLHNKSKEGMAGTALSRLLNSQLRRLEKQSWTSALLGPTRAQANLIIAPAVRHNGLTLQKSRLLFVSDESTMLAVVAGLSDAEGKRFGILAHKCLLQHRRSTSSTWIIDEPVESFFFGDATVRTPKCWRWTADRTLEVLH
jgi:hypothetical protein